MDELKIKKYFIYSIILLLFCFVLFFLKNFLFSEKAKKYANNNQNITNGCLIFVKKFSDKNGFVDYEVKVDGKKLILRHAVIDDFPFVYKYYYFKNELNRDHGCYNILYIKVKILNMERIYIYDLI